ncbi:hypothetical protein Acsp03_32030 [Actinomadura sp. NBRC 104412]|uniref:DUF397 domain-containing protein n=1 Tax=Actinomadura sp. NBRC 104412 TaxID=3032203 RepID=UPI0024A1A5D4|nr:DUF397 domain-containing protein [Actinomadura sp. NBRC 104412]GLZ05737.1 hypothetical protein Acsp03_32030 [Actinomadura sp. NBRC 104412]
MTERWRKSTHSGGVDDQHCVELARLEQGVGVRDSKHPETGHITLTSMEFSALVSWIRRQEP